MGVYDTMSIGMCEHNKLLEQVKTRFLLETPHQYPMPVCVLPHVDGVPVTHSALAEL